MAHLPSLTKKVMVFLSHTEGDRKFVRFLKTTLEHYGIQVFCNGVLLGPLNSQIEVAINECDFFILVWSLKAIESEWVRMEIQIALNRQFTQERAYFFPLLLDQGPKSLPHPLPQMDLRHYEISPSQFQNDPNVSSFIISLFESCLNHHDLGRKSNASLKHHLDARPSDDHFEHVRLDNIIGLIGRISDTEFAIGTLKETFEALTDSIYDRHRYWIAITLGKLCNPFIRTYLKNALATEEANYVRIGLEQALMKCTG
jgi:hypothetical protein